MATKSITITEEAYRRLKLRREGNESFSAIITRITRRKTLSDLFGTLSDETADRIEKRMKRRRAEVAKDYRRRMKQLQRKPKKHGVS